MTPSRTFEMDWRRCPYPFHRYQAIWATRWREISIEISLDWTDGAAHWTFEFIDWHLAPGMIEFPIRRKISIRRNVRMAADCLQP
jgi:hypothetical protein